MEKHKETSLIEMNFREVDQQMEDFNEQREKKSNIYRAFSEYIICLENSLEHETNPYQKSKIEQEIEALKIEQQKYYVPTILELADYDLIQAQRNKTVEESKNALENSDYSLVSDRPKTQIKKRRGKIYCVSEERKMEKVNVRKRGRIRRIKQ